MTDIDYSNQLLKLVIVFKPFILHRYNSYESCSVAPEIIQILSIPSAF